MEKVHKEEVPTRYNLRSHQNTLNKKDNDTNNDVTNSSSMTFHHPFTMIISGPTSCGKTQWLKQLLSHSVIDPPPQRIIFFYKRWQPLYDEMKRIKDIEFMKEIYGILC